MPSQKTDLAATAHYIKSIGLPLVDKAADIFEREIRPGIETKYANFKSKIGIVSARSFGILPTFEQGRADAQVHLIRRLRSFEYVAAATRGSDSDASRFEVILPEFWDCLEVQNNSNTVSDATSLFHNVYVAETSLLWVQQREAVRKAVFKLSFAAAKAAVAHPPDSARGQKTQAVRDWFSALQFKPRSRSAAMNLACKHFELQLANKEINRETIRLFIARQYPKKDDPGSPNET